MSAAFLAHPEWAGWLLSLTVLVGAWLAWAWLRGEARLRLLLGRSDCDRASRGARDLCLWLALLWIAVALLGPRLARERIQVSTSGTDVVVLVDVSRSMEAADVPPDRITHARRIAIEILERLPPESRAALAAFAGRGVVLTPLTPDVAALAEMVPALDSALLSEGGSDLAAGLESALAPFDSASARPKVLVLLSDGEWLEEEHRPAPTLLATSGVRIVPIALGSAHGGTLPDHGTPLRDAQGRVVVSRRNEQILAELASATGGRSFVADEWGQIEIESAMNEVLRDSPANAQPGEFIEREVLVPTVVPFAALALLLLLAEAGFGVPALLRSLRRSRAAGPPLAGATEGERSQRATRGGAIGAAATRAALLAPLLLLVAARPVSLSDAEAAQDHLRRLSALANSRSLDARELILLGLAHSALRHSGAAEQAFRQAAILSPNSDLAAIALHDLGVAALERRDLEVARERFFDALARNPAQRQSRFNLEWTLAALSKAPPDAPRKAAPEREAPEEERRPEPSNDAPPGESENSDPERTPPIERDSDRSQAEENEGERERAKNGAPTPQAPEPMDDQERDRWLERIEDDPSRAMRSAVRDGRERNPRRRRTPNW